MLIVGFGSIGQALVPFLFSHFQIAPSQISIITKDRDGSEIADAFGILMHIEDITPDNYLQLMEARLYEGDFLINVSVNVSSVRLIELCQKKGVLYIDTCTEPWEGGYVNKTLPLSSRTNYALRESVLTLKKNLTPTAVITHGANPGLISHFLKQALWNIANDNETELKSPPKTKDEWAALACSLNIKAIHIAEKDTQISCQTKCAGEFVNTWSVDGFISEGSQPAELGWGTHEQSLPDDGYHHLSGPQCSIYLTQPGASIHVHTWVPSAGASVGFLITHAESISISNYLTIKQENKVLYRPTVHYAYLPCPDAALSLYELAGRDWQEQENKRLITNTIIDGMDELGILLMGNQKGAYWFGSQLSIQEARLLAPYNNATSIQVVISVIAGMKWAIENPTAGVVEPEDIDFRFVMDIAEPYLGKIVGEYTDWDPLQNRDRSLNENLDHSDPWQFHNIRIKGDRAKQ